MSQAVLPPEAIARTGRAIGLCEPAVETVLRHLPSAEEIHTQYALLWRDPRAFLDVNAAHQAPFQRYLALFTAFAILTRADYAQHGISDTIWLDTMHDIARWEEAFFFRHGEHGLNQAGWLSLHMRRRLFALGELQFELPEKQEFSLPAELSALPVLYVHIPKGADLAKRSDSYQQALRFFSYPEAVLLCHSWLLSPALPKLLNPDSRILAFHSEFTLLQLDETSRQAEERIFGPKQDDPSLYPVTTSLQRRAREMLISGQKIPAAVGFIHLK